MSKKWYNYIVSVEGTTDQPAQSPDQPSSISKTAAQSIADIAATIAAEPQFTAPVSDPTSFDEIYKAAEITAAAKGYSILKVSQMLESEHIRNQPSDVRKSTVLVALEAAGVDIKDVIQDAIRRDRALDTYERVQQRAVEELEGRKTKENGDIQTQIDKYLTEQRAKIQSNNDAISREKERFTAWRQKKQQEEKKIADAVGYFVAENPITTGDVKSAASPETASRRS